MASVDGSDIQPRFEAPADRSVEQPSVSYNARADSVIVFFYGPPEPSYSVPSDADPHLMFLTHLDEHYVVGVEIEGFVKSFLPLHPEMLDLARLAGVPERTLVELESGMGAQRRKAAVVSLLRERFAEAFAVAG